MGSRALSLVKCFVEDTELPAALANEHHMHPTEAGGPDTPDNKVWLCPGCHQTLHRLAEHILAGKVGQAKDLCNMYTKSPAAAQRLYGLANKAAGHIREYEESTPMAARRDIKVSVDLDSYDYMALKAMAADYKDCNNRRLTVPSYIKMLVKGHIQRKRMPGTVKF